MWVRTKSRKGRPAIGIIAFRPASAARCCAGVRDTPAASTRIRVPRPRARTTARAASEDEPPCEPQAPLAAGRAGDLPERVAGGGAVAGARVAPADRVRDVVGVDAELDEAAAG